jgi:hypothetical protein
MKVIESIEADDGMRCVDLLLRLDGSLAYKEFRKDVEDGGRWQLVNDFSHRAYESRSSLLQDALRSVPWLHLSAQGRFAGGERHRHSWTKSRK